jgi:hypothetical protein
VKKQRVMRKNQISFVLDGLLDNRWGYIEGEKDPRNFPISISDLKSYVITFPCCPMRCPSFDDVCEIPDSHPWILVGTKKESRFLGGTRFGISYTKSGW